MAYPAGITLSTITVGSVIDFFGESTDISVTVRPVLGGDGKAKHIVHADTGHVMLVRTMVFQGSPGGPISFNVPHVDQDGFVTSAGEAITMWAYEATVVYGKGKEERWVKNFQPLIGQDLLDLDLIPDGNITAPVTAPAAAVTSVNGTTGAVTLLEATPENVEAGLPPRLSEAELSSTTASVMRREIPLRGAADRFRQLTVMVYHPVNMATFRNDLDYYQEWNYKTVTMRDVWEHLEGISTLPDKPLWITFDDGLPTQYTAAEELKNRGMIGIFYIATGWIDGTVTQAQGGFAEATPLTWAQIQQMHAWGHDIQSHTKSHIPLGDQVEATVKAEFTDSKARIEAQVPGTLVEHIAYPYGSWNDDTEVWLEEAGCKLGRAVRIDRDGRYPGPNMGRDSIATTAHRRFGIPCAGANFGDVQRPNFFREIGHEPEWCPDYGFEGGAKGWSLGSGFSVDSNAANAHSGTKSLTCMQGTSTVSSRPFRVMPIGPFNRLQISGWIRSTLPAGSYAKVQLQTLKVDGTVNGVNIDIGTVTGPVGWTKFTYEYVGLEHDRNALLFLAVQGNAAPSGQAWFDDISVKVENAPSALSV